MLTSEVVRRLNAIDDRLHEAQAGADKAVGILDTIHKNLVFLRDEVRRANECTCPCHDAADAGPELLAACIELRHAPLLTDATLAEVEAIRARADAAIAKAKEPPHA